MTRSAFGLETHAARIGRMPRAMLTALLLMPGLAQADITVFHCIDLNDPSTPAGRVSVRIGYINDSTTTETLPCGINNYFSPAPACRGHPTEFLPGVHDDAFVVYLVEDDPYPDAYVVNGVARTLTQTAEDICSGGVSALAVAPSGVLYAGTAQAGVYRSTDDGASWHAINTGLGDLHVHTIELHPSDPSTLFVGTDDGVYRSVDGGDNWEAINSGLPGAGTP